MKIEIKHKVSGRVLFAHEAEENTTWITVRAAVAAKTNLSGADLSGTNLSGADLSGADLYGADLYGANLYGANLYGANLYGANLRGTNLRGTNLSGTNLSGANLRGANLSGTNLSGTNLRGANLSGTNLSGANLSGTNLSGTNLSGANLSGANLRGANLRGAVGNNRELKTIQAGPWVANYTDTVMSIGCQQHEIKRWWEFTHEEIDAMASDAVEWWAIWKPLLEKITKVSPARPTGYAGKEQ